MGKKEKQNQVVLSLASTHEEDKREIDKLRKEINHLENDSYQNDRYKM